MFDADTSSLISGAPELEGLELSELPNQLTDAYATIVAARVRLREIDDNFKLPEDIESIATKMRKIAFTNEAFVSALPNRDDRSSAAFVAGAAHHVALMASRIGRREKTETRVLFHSVSPEISATLLFMIAEASADAAEMAKEIAIPHNSPVEASLLLAIINLSRGKIAAIFESALPSFDPLQIKMVGERGIAALLYEILRGVRQLARELLGAPHSAGNSQSAVSIFAAVRDICIQNLDQEGMPIALLSAFPGPRHIASLLMSVADNLAPAAVVNISPPPEIDADLWSMMLKKVADRRPYLWRNHRQAIAAGYLENGTSSSVSFPTGAGKSTLAELKIGAVLLSGKKVVFLAPTLALVEQTSTALRGTFAGTSIQSERGEASVFEDFLGQLPSVSVMTTERCLALLGFDAAAFSDVGLLVFDECHLLHSGEFDVSHRAVDAMLCVLNFVTIAPAADLLLLSAMMKNAEEIASWIGSMTHRPCLSLDLTWKPTRQVRGCVVYDGDEIDSLNATLSATRATATTKKPPAAIARTLNARPLGLFSLKQTWLSQSRADYRLLPLLDEQLELSTGINRNDSWYLTPNGNKLASALAIATARQSLKTLVFVQTIPLASSAVKSINAGLKATKILLTSEEDGYLRDAIDDLGDLLHSYITTTPGGWVDITSVCHHSLLLPAERQLHESLFKRPDGVRVMVATSTLAQGMNLPSEVVIIGGDSRFDRTANKVQRLEAHELLNAAGRAGRAGDSSYGFVLVIPSKVVHFADSKNEIGRHWMDLQTIFAQSDQCVTIDDPLTVLLDQMTMPLGSRSEAATYLLSRLPVGTVDDRDGAAKILLQKSFAVFRKQKANDLEWISNRISGALNARAADTAAAPSSPTWIDHLSATTGVPKGFLSLLGQSMSAVQLPSPANVEQWRDWLISVLRSQPEFASQLIRPSTSEAVLGKKYKALDNDKARGEFILDYFTVPLKQWMAGSTLAEIELSFGTEPAALGKLDAARNFVLRMIPELAFVFGLPLLVVRAMKKGTDQENVLPGLGISGLASCVRGGFDAADKLALKHASVGRLSRVAVHRKYVSLLTSLVPATEAEDLMSAVNRIRGALR